MFHPRANEMAAWPRRAHDLEAPGRTSATRAEPPGLHMPEITLRKEARFRDPKFVKCCRLPRLHAVCAVSRLLDALRDRNPVGISPQHQGRGHDRRRPRCLQASAIAIDDIVVDRDVLAGLHVPDVHSSGRLMVARGNRRVSTRKDNTDRHLR